ncbi:MAG: hypothetical protein JO240_05945 [Solirubrobacterales bacterium]|nr:hypothetical protein [Solirubrobacterales bacterium]
MSLMQRVLVQHVGESALVLGVEPEVPDQLWFWEEGHGEPLPLDPGKSVHVFWVTVDGQERPWLVGGNLGRPEVRRVVIDAPIPSGGGVMGYEPPLGLRPFPHWPHPLWVAGGEFFWPGRGASITVRWLARRRGLPLPRRPRPWREWHWLGWRTVHEERVVLDGARRRKD